MFALSIVTHNPELRTYFQRKVAEGNNEMFIINYVRNKLVHRVFSAIEK